MQMVEARTCTLAPGACTLDTTDHPNCTELTWAQNSPAAPRSQSFPRRPRQKCQKETHLCSSQVQVQFPGRRSLFGRFRTAEFNQSHHITVCLNSLSFLLKKGREVTTELKHGGLCQLLFFLNVYNLFVCNNALCN